MSYQAVPIQDRVDIDNLFSAYAYTLDDGDADGWIALYTEDGVFDVPGLNRFEGQEGLRAIADIVINGSQGNWRHMATNVLVTPGASGDEVAVRLRTLVTPTHKITTYTGHRGPEAYGELFDVGNNPHETFNLWDSSAHAALRRELIEQLHHRMTETDIALPRRIGHA